MTYTPISSPERRGLMFVLSSPSGAGKTTLSRLLLEQDDNLTMSVSATTREKRSNEVEGRDYYFVDEKTFGKMIENNELLECAVVFGCHYGTPEKKVMESIEAGKDVLFDIDWQGTESLLKRCRQDVVSVFILPPSIEELERRLKNRAQDSAEVVASRMAKANDEISHWCLYDYVLINDSLEQTLEDIHAILKAERVKRERQYGLIDFVKQLIS